MGLLVLQELALYRIMVGQLVLQEPALYRIMVGLLQELALYRITVGLLQELALYRITVGLLQELALHRIIVGQRGCYKDWPCIGLQEKSGTGLGWDSKTVTWTNPEQDYRD